MFVFGTGEVNEDVFCLVEGSSEVLMRCESIYMNCDEVMMRYMIEDVLDFRCSILDVGSVSKLTAWGAVQRYKYAVGSPVSGVSVRLRELGK